MGVATYLCNFIFYDRIIALSTYFLTAGSFERVEDNGRTILVEGSYQSVESSPITPFEILQAIPLGMEDSAQIIFYIFLIGGTFGIITKTGAIDLAIYGIVNRLKHKGIMLIPIIMVAFQFQVQPLECQKKLLSLSQLV